jgi:LmbE family N-acetylglucosaminyl deacetylase
MAAAIQAQSVRPMKEFVRLIASRCCQFALQFSSQPYRVRSGTTVVFAPHQDDETLGCGALIARKRNQDQPVHVVFLTDGAASHPRHPWITPTGIAAIRAQEARHVLAVLGVDAAALHFLDEPDGTLDRLTAARHESLLARLAALLRHLQPDEIFLPCRAEGSSEHEAAFTVIIAAIRRADVRATIWEYPVWMWWNPRVQLRRLLFARDRCRAPAGDFLPIKRRALVHYRSQLESLPPQSESPLPRDLLRLLDTPVEFFFRLAPLATATPVSAAPII